MIKEQLSDNIALNYIGLNKFKSNYLSVSFLLPFEKRSAAMNTLIMKILKRGTVNYPDMTALSKKLEYLYSADIFTKATSFGETQVLSFSIDALDNRFATDGTDILGEAIKLLGEIIFAPVTENGVFKEAYFESEKRNQLDDISAEINSKAKYALSRCSEHMFKDEKYRFSSLGDYDAVAGFTNKEVYSHYLSILSHAAVNVTFVGNADIEKLKSSLLEMLKPYAPSDIYKCSTEVVRSVDVPKEIQEECVGKQGNLVMGFRSGTVLSDGDYPRMALMSELYGGAPSSKLFMNVREKMSLCYYCVSIPEAVKGIMFVRAGIENANFETARDAILEQLELMKKGEFGDDELESAKLSLINAYREISDNPQSLQNWYIGRALSGITQSPDEAIEAVKNITREEIVATANKVVLDTVYFLRGVMKGE
ncbi:MAG: insulinase family protein [Clostridia bacterium]|nr:insulinase family protein [Clostridia bacterium]